jgi:hypothetical protein
MTDSDSDGFALVDRHRSADLDDVGGRGLTVAVTVDDTGTEHLVIVKRCNLGDRATGFSRFSPDHEMLGPLPLEFLRRVAIAQRIHRPKAVDE